MIIQELAPIVATMGYIYVCQWTETVTSTPVTRREYLIWIIQVVCVGDPPMAVTKSTGSGRSTLATSTCYTASTMMIPGGGDASNA